MMEKRKPGRPSKGIIQDGTHISANVPIEIANALRDHSKTCGISITFMVQKALADYVKKEVKPAK